MSPIGSNYLNPSVIMETRTDRVQLIDTEQHLLDLKFDPGLSRDPETPNDYHTIEIQEAGDAGDLLVIVRIGEANAAKTALLVSTATTHRFSAAGTVTAGTTVHTTADLAALISELNTVEGLIARRGHGDRAFALNNANFIVLAETDINNTFSRGLGEFLFRDASAVNATAIRIGVPEDIDSGRMNLHSIAGTATGVTNGTITVSEDPDPDVFGGVIPPKREILRRILLSPETEYIGDDYLTSSVYRGPLLVEVVSDDLTALDLLIRTVNAEY